MDGRTYYMILGVPRTESPGGIRSAYRDLARKLHPDVAGEQATQAFQEITEAYDVLSDPERRRAYNDQLRRAEGGDVVPVRRAPPRTTPALNVEVILTPEESRHGCVLPLVVPVFRRCSQCGGSGWDWVFPCLACGQQGTIEDEEIVRLRIPPAARSGSIVDLPVRRRGVQMFSVRAHVFVESDVVNERR